MKKLLAIVSIVAAVFTASAYEQVQGIYIDGTTNTVTVSGVSTNVSKVAAASTNHFNLSTTLQAQSNTNLWPAMPFNGAYGINGRNLAIGISFNCDRTNDLGMVFRFAAYNNGRWMSNYFVTTVTADGTGMKTVITNCDLYGIPIIALQAIENINATATMSNLLVTATYKEGL